ncbi:MAG TPA: hypothetical protein VH482_27885 [Thermomicrobiales bacterium]|jgi:hypothetical protein
MKDAIEWLGNVRIDNLAHYGVLADTIEVAIALAMMIGGIYITHLIQKWADKAGEQPGAVNVGRGGGYERYEQRSMRN